MVDLLVCRGININYGNSLATVIYVWCLLRRTLLFSTSWRCCKASHSSQGATLALGATYNWSWPAVDCDIGRRLPNRQRRCGRARICSGLWTGGKLMFSKKTSPIWNDFKYIRRLLMAYIFIYLFVSFERSSKYKVYGTRIHPHEILNLWLWLSSVNCRRSIRYQAA